VANADDVKSSSPTLSANAVCSTLSITTHIAVSLFQADLAITKTGPASAFLGSNVTYTVVVTNPTTKTLLSGYINVTDSFPSSLSVVQWACSGSACMATSGSGSFPNYALGSMSGSSTVTFTITASVIGGAGSTVNNTAVVSYIGDPIPSNNIATVSTTVTAGPADLSITKTDGGVLSIPGTNVIYTIIATNNGPTDATTATITDVFLSSSFSNIIWQCVGAGGAVCNGATGTGDIIAIVYLPAGGLVTFTVTGTIYSSKLGALSNTASVFSNNVTDTFSANNFAMDVNALTPQVDLQVYKSVSPNNTYAGLFVTYSIQVFNHGPSDAAIGSVCITDNFPSGLQNVLWSCTSFGVGASCVTGTLSGDITDAIANLPFQASIQYVATAQISSSVTATNVINWASTFGYGPVTAINTTDDQSSVNLAFGRAIDLSVTKSDGVATATPGLTTTYTINVTNFGPR